MIPLTFFVLFFFFFFISCDVAYKIGEGKREVRVERLKELQPTKVRKSPNGQLLYSSNVYDELSNIVGGGITINIMTSSSPDYIKCSHGQNLPQGLMPFG